MLAGGFKVRLVLEVGLRDGSKAKLPITDYYYEVVTDDMLQDIQPRVGLHAQCGVSETLNRIAELLLADDDHLFFVAYPCYRSNFLKAATFKLTDEHPHENVAPLTATSELRRYASDKALALLPTELTEVSHAF